MSVNKPKLLTGRVPVVDYANLSADRYQFLGLGQAEPNLGPGANNTVLTISTDNTRVWANALNLTGNIFANNISSGNIISAAGNIFGGGIRSTSSPTAPLNPSVGDFWYNTATNVQYRFTFDGTSYYWVDDYGSTVGTTGSFSILLNGNSNVAVFNNGNIIAGVGGVGNVVTWASTGEYVNGVVSASGNIYTAGEVSATGNIVVSPTGFFIGNLIGNTIGCIAVPGANTQVLYNNEGNVGASPAFTFDSATSIATITGNIQGGSFLTAGQVSAAGSITGQNIYTAGEVSAAGNVTGNYIIGNGSQLTGLASVYANALVGDTLSSNVLFSSLTSVGILANLSVSGNIDSGNIHTAGFISALGNIVGGNLRTAGFVGATGFISALGNIIGGSIRTTGVVSATGNVTGNYIIGNGSQLSGIVSSSNFYANALIGNTLSSNVLFSSLTSVGTLSNLSVSNNVNSGNILNTGFVSATGNITGNYIIGNGSLLTGIIPPTTGYANALVGNTLSSNVLFSSLTSVGILTALSVSGDVNGGNILNTGIVSAVGNIIGGNILTTGQISSVGNITVGTGSFFVGNLIGNFSGNLIAPGADTQVLYNGNGVISASAGFTFNQGTNALVSTGTITGGNFLTGGLVSAVGNVTGNYFVGNGSRLFSITGANVVGSVANATYANTSGTAGTVTTNAQPNITSVGTLTSVTSSGLVSTTGNIVGANILTAGIMSSAGNAIHGNVLTSGLVSSTGNAVHGNVLTSGLVSSTGNAVHGNVLTGGLISAAGNIVTAGNFIGNLIGNISGNVVAPGLNTQVIYNSNGNLAGSPGFTFTPGTNALVSTGTITGSNFLTGGLVSAAGNITGSQFVGNGNTISNIQGANISGSVANATYANTSGTAGTVTTNAQANITSVGTLTSLSVAGNTTSNNISVGNIISATGNIVTAGFFVGAFAGSISGNVTAPGLNTQVIYNSSGNLAGSPGFTFNQASNALAATGTITGSNFLTGGLVSAAGNVTGNYIVGNGSVLSSITGANVVGPVANAAYANTATTASTVTANTQANITSVGILTSLSVSGDTTSNNITVGNIISATGNIVTAGFFVGNLIGNITGNIAITGANTQVLYNNQGNVGASAGFTFNQASNALIVTGNVTGANLLTAGSISAAGNINANNITSTNYNGTTISASGTVTAGQFVGNGNTISNIQGANVSGNVTSAITAGTVTANAQANITSVGTLTSLSVSGNTNTGNILTSGQISTGGNITTNAYFIGTFLGNISGNLTVPGSNTQVIFNNGGNAGASAGFTFDSNGNVVTITGNTVVGNLRTAGQITATGNILSGNVLAINAVNAASHTGAAVSVTGNITGSRFIGSGNSLSNITGANVTGQVSNALVAGTVYTNAQPNITSVGTLTSLAVTSNITGGNLLTGGIISASGNVTSNAYFIGNFLGNITGNLTVPGSNTQVLYNDNGNAGASPGLTFNAASNLLVVGGTISSTGNVSGGNIFSAAVISSVGNIVSAANIVAGGNAPTGAALNGIGLVAGNNAGAPFATFVYNSITQGWMSNVSISPAANTTLNLGTTNNWWNNFYAFNITSSTIAANANISGGNLLTVGAVSATGNITTAGYFVGNFAGNITGNLSVPGSNTQVIYNNNGNAGASTGFTFNAASNAAVIAGNITGGNILTIGLMSSTGNAVHGNVSTGGQVSAVANITGANLLTGGQVSATGNITTGGNFIGNLIGNITGNFTVPGSNTQIIYNNNGNAGASAGLTFNSATNALATTGTVSATGNVTANYFIGNGSQLTGITVAATFPVANGTSNVNAAVNSNITLGVGGTANVAVFATTGEYVSGVVSASGNVIGANILTGGLMSSTGNAVHGNVLTAGLVSATSTITSAANIAGANILTAGLMSSTGNAVHGNVLTAGVMSSTGNAIHGNVLTAGLISATGNITTGGYFLGTFAGSISGNVTAPGTNTQVVYNNSGNLAGSSSFTFNQATTVLSVSTGTISVGNIVNSNGNGVGNIGNASSYFNTVFAQATSAVYADLAEMYAADSDYEPGTVVEFGGVNEITASSTDHSILVAGIISTNPSYLMNSAQAGEHALPVALTGRAPCRVVGKINRGARLTTSSITGVATVLDIAKYQPGCIIGKALEDYDSDKVGIIEIAVGRF